jgi:hypothetical protein
MRKIRSITVEAIDHQDGSTTVTIKRKRFGSPESIVYHAIIPPEQTAKGPANSRITIDVHARGKISLPNILYL